MNDEFRKVFSNRHVLLLLFAVILLNGAAFYQSCVTPGPDGYSLTQLGAKYAAEDLEGELEDLETRIHAAVLSGDFSDLEGGGLLTGDVFCERNLDRAVLERITQASGYPDYLAGLQLASALKLNSGLFGGDGSFAVRSIRKSMELYAQLEHVVPAAAFSGGVEALTRWRAADLFILLFCCVAGLQLVPQERAAGYLLLLHPTAGGHGRLYRRKFLAVAETAAFFCVLLYGMNALITAAVLGLGDLSIPIQSVYGMRNCPLQLTVGAYLALFFGCKLLWALSVASLFFLLCSGFRQSASVLLSAAGLAGVFFAMGTGSSLWLRTLSLSWWADCTRLWDTALFLNFFGVPVRQAHVFFLLCALVIAVSFAGGLALFCRLPAVPAAQRRRPPLPFRNRHTNLFRHEAYKVFLSGRWLLILALFLAAQVFSYQNFYVRNDPAEYYYRQYSSFLDGPPTAEKDAYLRAEEARFAQLGSEISRYGELLKDQPSALSLVTADLEQQLLPRAGFDLAKSQYDGLQSGAAYVYQTGYVRLFGPQGQAECLQNLAKLFFVLILGLFGIFAGERESGVSLLQCASGRSRAILRRKGALILIFLAAAASIAFLPQYLAVGRGYGLPQWTATLQSVSVGAGLPGSWPIFSLFLITAAAQFLLGLAACGVIAWVSSATGNSILTILISSAALLLPVCAFLLQ